MYEVVTEWRCPCAAAHRHLCTRTRTPTPMYQGHLLWLYAPHLPAVKAKVKVNEYGINGKAAIALTFINVCKKPKEGDKLEAFLHVKVPSAVASAGLPTQYNKMFTGTFPTDRRAKA